MLRTVLVLDEDSGTTLGGTICCMPNPVLMYCFLRISQSSRNIVLRVERLPSPLDASQNPTNRLMWLCELWANSGTRTYATRVLGRYLRRQERTLLYESLRIGCA